MFDSLAAVEARYDEIAQLMADPEIATDYERVAELAKERSDLQDLVETYRRHRSVQDELAGVKSLLAENGQDPELAELAREEMANLEAELEELEHQLKMMLVPSDPNDDKNVIVEIRAGTGGDEAGLFAADLFRM